MVELFSSCVLKEIACYQFVEREVGFFLHDQGGYLSFGPFDLLQCLIGSLLATFYWPYQSSKTPKGIRLPWQN